MFSYDGTDLPNLMSQVLVVVAFRNAPAQENQRSTNFHEKGGRQRLGLLPRRLH